MTICPIRTNFDTMISKSINHAKFAYRWQETFKISVLTVKCSLPINSCYKVFFFPRYFYIKKWQLSIFFLFKGKRHVWMTSIKIIMKLREVFSRFEENKNVINISSIENWFKFLRALFEPFNFIKWQENICHRSKRWSHGHAIFLFTENIIRYEIQFLSSQWQNILKLRFIYTLYNILITIKMVWPWDRLLDLLWQMFSCHFMNSNDLNSVLRNLNQIFTEDMLITFCSLRIGWTPLAISWWF